MIDKENVFNFVKIRGPVLPRDISKEFKENTFITGAVLSSLVDEKRLKISYAKIGGSPVYYVPGQEERLSLLYKYLPSKEKEAYDLLKNQKIIKENDCEPAIRVALKNIKDFAKPLEVNINEKKEIFWKWYLLNNNDAETLIKKIITEKTEKKEDKNEEYKDKIYEKKIIDENKKTESEALNKLDKKEQVEKNLNEKEKEQKTLIDESNEKKIYQDLEKKENILKKEDSLFSKIEKVFLEKEIEILDYKIIRKNSDIELLVNIKSPVGKLKYFCKVRDKKTNNDKDLSAVYVQGQIKKLPILYVTTGELTKKAKEMLENEFKLISVLKI